MERIYYDVVIVGAGPIGGRAGTLLALEGLKVLMLEEHNEIGRPFQCAGLGHTLCNECRKSLRNRP